MSSKKSYRKWTDQDMKNALAAVQQGMSMGKAAKAFNVPKQTISDRIRGKYNTTKPGRPTELTDSEEDALIYYIKYMASIANPLSVSAIKGFAWNIAKKKDTTRFNEISGPGHSWWEKFKKRHAKDLTLRKPDNLDRGHSRMGNQTVMNQHFALLKETLKKLDIFDKPERIFNCDESGIAMDAKAGKVCLNLCFCTFT